MPLERDNLGSILRPGAFISSGLKSPKKRFFQAGQGTPGTGQRLGG